MTWQPAPIVYPDAEALVTAALPALLTAASETGVFVGRKVPNPRRTRMVIVTRDGGGSSELRDRPRLRVRVWDETDQKATDLARKVVAIMLGLPVTTAGVARVSHESGPYEIPDEKPQRYLLFELHTRGAVLT